MARYQGAPADVNYLDITIPDGLLAAAGLSAGAAAVTSVINGVKRNPNPQQETALSTQHTTPKRKGYLEKADKPKPSHLITRSEVGVSDELDWSKVQALLPTAMLLLLYGFAMWRMLSDPTPAWTTAATASLPELSVTLAALLAASLAGYEGAKLANYSTTSLISVAVLTPGESAIGRVLGDGRTIVFERATLHGITQRSHYEIDDTSYSGGTYSGKRVVFEIPAAGDRVTSIQKLP